MWVTATLVAEPDTDSEQRVRRFALSPLLSCLDVPSSPSDRRRDGYCARLQPRVGVPYRDHAVNRERPAYSTASIHDASAPDRPASAARKVEKATPRRAGIREAQCRSLPVWPRRGLHAAGAYHGVLAPSPSCSGRITRPIPSLLGTQREQRDHQSCSRGSSPWVQSWRRWSVSACPGSGK